MLVKKILRPYICRRCLHRQIKPQPLYAHHDFINRTFTSTSPPGEQEATAQRPKENDGEDEKANEIDGVGAMSRRLADMTDEALESGGRSARKAMEEAGFSEELKRQLESRIEDSSFRSENPSAFAQTEMPVRKYSFPLGLSS